MNTRECGNHRLRKHRYGEKQFLGAAGFQWNSFARALTYLLQPPRRRKGNPWFFDYFGLFFAFGTEITCRSNVAIAGLTLPTATKLCPRYQASSTSSSSPTSSSANRHIARPVPLFSHDTLRVFATSSLVPHSFLVKVICSVHTVEDSFSWRQTRVYPTCRSAASGTDTWQT